MNQKIFLKIRLDCQSSATRKWNCLLNNCHRTETGPSSSDCSTPTLDEWSAFATFLADVIEKYASVLEIDKAESLSNNENQQDAVDTVRFLYKGIIIKHNKTEPTYTKTSLFLCEKRRFLWPGLRKEGNLFKLAGPGGLAFFHLTKKEVSKWPMKK